MHHRANGSIAREKALNMRRKQRGIGDRILGGLTIRQARKLRRIGDNLQSHSSTDWPDAADSLLRHGSGDRPNRGAITLQCRGSLSFPLLPDDSRRIGSERVGLQMAGDGVEHPKLIRREPIQQMTPDRGRMDRPRATEQITTRRRNNDPHAGIVFGRALVIDAWRAEEVSPLPLRSAHNLRITP